MHWKDVSFVFFVTFTITDYEVYENCWKITLVPEMKGTNIEKERNNKLCKIVMTGKTKRVCAVLLQRLYFSSFICLFEDLQWQVNYMRYNISPLKSISSWNLRFLSGAYV